MKWLTRLKKPTPVEKRHEVFLNNTTLNAFKMYWTHVPCAHKNMFYPLTARKWYNEEKMRNPRYEKVPILYKETAEGYRVYDEYGGSNIIACFGCSNTYGVGLPDNETWPYILWKQLGQKQHTVFNFGFSGASADHISRVISCFLEHVKPKAIFCLFPEITRREYYSNSLDRINNFCVQHHEHTPKDEYETIYRTIDTENSFLNFIRNFKYVEALCKLHNVPLIWHTWSLLLLNVDSGVLKDVLNTDTTMIVDSNKLLDIQGKYKLHDIHYKARDGGHNGYEYNKILANEFYNVTVKK